MFGLFLRLYVLMIGTMAGTFAIALAAFIPLMKGIEKQDDLRLLSGTFELAVAELAPLSGGEMRNRVENLGERFGGIVSLISLEDLDREDGELSGLEQGKLVSRFEQDTFYRRIPGTGNVLRIKPRLHGSPWFMGEDERLSGLTLHLLGEAFHDKAAPAKRFGFPVAVVQLEGLELNEKGASVLIRDGAFFDQDTLKAFHIGKADGRVVVLGPLDDGESVYFRYSFYLLLFIILVVCAGASLIWARPLWRDMDILSGTARRFGKGEFTARAKISPRSSLGGTAGVFNSMAERIESLLAFQKDLTNAVSHELKTPLARLKFSLVMAAEAGSGSEGEPFLGESMKNIEELDTLVEDLLTHASLDQPARDDMLRKVEMGSWLRGVVLGLGASRDGKTVTEGDFPREGVLAAMEPVLMERALGNLILNGVRYARTRVVVSFESIDTGICILVEDDGPGVPEAERERIFEAFQRMDPSRSRDSGNYGLGLAIVRRVARWHGGDAMVTDSALGGARFIIQWPRERKTDGQGGTDS